MTTAIDRGERRRRELASAVRRLRVAATSDPERGGELADALVALTGSRLLAWSFAEAATDAPESVLAAARILAGGGPPGPYSSLPDAVRYFTASAQLAAVQAGLGQAEAAGRTLDALEAWRRQLGRLPLLDHLDPVPAVWALAARCRSLLGVDVPAANSCADAVLARLYAAGLEADPDHAYLAVATHLAVADARWAAGRQQAALVHHWLARSRHAAVTRGADRPRPAVARVAVAPAAALHEPFAERLEAAGHGAAALAVWREYLDLLNRFTSADDAAPAVARAGLGHALQRLGREGEGAAELAVAERLAARPWPAPPPPSAPGAPVDWPPPGAAEAGLQQDEDSAQVALGEYLARAAATEERLLADFGRAAAEQSARQALAARRAADAEAAARRAAADLARREAEAAAARREAEAEAARRAAAERRRELAEARRAPTDALALEAAAGQLDGARAAAAAAGTDLVPLAVAEERLAELLRPLAAAWPDEHGGELAATLDALVALRWRLGDPEGSKEAAREAKALAARLGR